MSNEEALAEQLANGIKAWTLIREIPGLGLAERSVYIDTPHGKVVPLFTDPKLGLELARRVVPGGAVVTNFPTLRWMDIVLKYLKKLGVNHAGIDYIPSSPDKPERGTLVPIEQAAAALGLA
jgi:hypothetical protein